MRQKLAGLDINGWHDWIVRNWTPYADQQGLDQPEVTDGGVDSNVIWMGDNGGTFPVGGPQAGIAPHGRGGSWGQIGDEGRRVSVRKLLRALVSENEIAERDIQSLEAAIKAIAADSETLIVAVPDIPSFDDTAQARLLDVLRKARLRRPLLVWRPVLLALRAIDLGHLTEPGQKAGVISLGATGLEYQVLTIRSTVHAEKTILAPERRSFGQLLGGGAGLATIKEQFIEAVCSENDAEYQDIIRQQSRLPVKLMTGAADSDEILRRSNGTWVQIMAPRSTPKPNIEMPSFQDLMLSDIDVILVEDSFSAEISQALLQHLENCGRPVVKLEKHDTAFGAWYAANRYAAGAPVYFDFLPQIKIVALRGGEAEFIPLVPEGDTVKANDVYRTENPPQYEWPKGQTEIEFYIEKEGSEKIRKWLTTRDHGPVENMKVEVVLEQQPAQGRATIEVRSKDWPDLRSQPILLDWNNLTIDDRSAGEILKSLEKPKPAIPERTVLPTDSVAWIDPFDNRDLPAALDQFDAENAESVKLLRDLLGKKAKQDRFSPAYYYAVDSDGELPEKLKNLSSNEAKLNSALSGAAEALDARIRSGRAISNNNLHLMATWTFTRCPIAIQEHIVDALESRSRTHPLWKPRGALQSLYQGIGRSAKRNDIMKRTIGHVLSITMYDIRQHHLACIAFLLSRRVNVFEILTNEDMEKIVEIGTHYITVGHVTTSGKYKQIYSYALLLIGGLLRYRNREPYAFLPENDPKVQIALTEAVADLSKYTRSNNDPRLEKKLIVTKQLLEMLEGGEGSPNLLREILDTA